MLVIRTKYNNLEIKCIKPLTIRETDLNEVLQINKIFRDAIKGDLVKKDEFDNTFPNMSYEDVVKLILDKGEIQISEKERNLNFQNMKNYIANIIVEKTYNKDNGLPFPQAVILQVLEDINYNVNQNEDEKKQALKAIKLIQDKQILPIERKLMQICLTIKNPKNYIDEKEFTVFNENILKFLKGTNSAIVEQNLESANNFKIKCNILPNHFREILTNYKDSN